MSYYPVDQDECQQDVMQRCHKWIDTLEQRITQLLNTNDPQEMTSGEREQAASRYLMVLLHTLQLRQQHALTPPSPGEQALLDVLLRRMEE